ncbi:MAG TPA: SAV_6107 family HEPN domain-containing protein [Frankiaceae bacterium]|nr:SAV_6107 family HEPN domain-containing protein [Frankiaceae bacterium]
MPPNAAVPAIHTSVADLLKLARHGLAEAAVATSPAERYATAHLSALRGAAAVIAARAQPTTKPGRRTRPVSAWVLLAAIAPELAEWAAFFAAGATKRANAEARLPGAVTAREADDLLRDAETFLAVVQTKLGGAAIPSLLDQGLR